MRDYFLIFLFFVVALVAASCFEFYILDAVGDTDVQAEVIAVVDKEYADGTLDILLTTEGDPNDPNRVEFEVLDASGEESRDAWVVNEYFTPLGERLIREIVRDEVRAMQAQGYRLDPNAADEGRIEFVWIDTDE